MVNHFNISKSYNYATYLFSKKVEKTTLFRDNFFIVCGLRPVPHWSAVLISRNHSIIRLISFPKKLKKRPYSEITSLFLRAPRQSDRAHAHLEMCASKQCYDWSEPWCELWAPIGYLILITAKIFPSYLTPRSATSKSSATSQRALKFFGSEPHVKKDSKFFFH